MYFYTAYGLGIHSDVPLPELVAAADIRADVNIQIGKVDRSPSEIDMGNYRFHMTVEEVYFVWEQLGTFLVRDGKEIIVEPFPGAEDHLIHFPILGMAMALLLHQRGFLVLHASAVAVSGGAVAFLGRRGQGKSTMAAMLYARGHNLIADDLLALDIGGTRSPIVLPGFPQFRLWPEAVAACLGDDPEVLPRLVSGCEKRARRAADRFSQRLLPLRGIYVLSEGLAPELKPLRPQEAIVQLINNSYIALVAKPLLQGEGASLHFRQCTSLIKNVPFYCLERPRSLPLLPAVAQLMEEHLAHDIQLATV